MSLDLSSASRSGLWKIAATPLTIFSSVAIAITGLWMYFFDKIHWLQDFHGNVGLLFVGAAILHGALNHRPLNRHLQTRSSYWSALPVLLLLSGFLVAAWIESQQGPGQVKPQQILRGLQKSQIQTLAPAFGTESESVIKNLTAHGLSVQGPQETVEQVAQANDREPREIFGYFLKR